MIDEETRAIFVENDGDNVVADFLHEGSGQCFDDVSSAGGGDEKVRVAGHQLDGAATIAAALEGGDPRYRLDADAQDEAFAPLPLSSAGNARTARLRVKM